MAGTTISVKGFLVDFLMPILPKSDKESTREALIKIHRIISGNTASMALNLRGCRHGQLALTIITEDYMAHMGYTFVPPHNLVDYPQK